MIGESSDFNSGACRPAVPLEFAATGFEPDCRLNPTSVKKIHFENEFSLALDSLFSGS